jgi:hypothetical protein
MTYYEKLKLPQWQRKRLEIMEHANFSCEECGTDKVPLHVHHTYYEAGLDPWAYPDESLVCLCEPCHRKAQNLPTLLQRQIGKLGVGGTLEQLLGYTYGLKANNNAELVIDLFSFDVAQGVADAWHIPDWELMAATQEGQIDSEMLYRMWQKRHPLREPRDSDAAPEHDEGQEG